MKKSFIAELFEECQTVLDSRKPGYAPTGNRWGNFVRRGQLLGMSPELVAMVDASKHFDSILQHLTQGAAHPEGARSRYIDCINYLGIAASLHVGEGKE